MISEKSIQEVFDIARVEDIVEEFVSLKRRGSNLIGLCPFHNEKTPSFSVSPSKNIYKCFGCGKGGGPVQFLMEHEQMTFPEAIRYLAGKYQIELEEDERGEEFDQDLAKRERLLLINQAALEFFKHQLLSTDLGKSVGLSYLVDRGFSKQTIDQFGLGFAPPGGTALTSALIQKGYEKDLIEDLGLSTKSGIDFFRDRIMFALHNTTGKVTGFAGRAIKEGKRIPKYMNSPESEVYIKSKFLYGLFFAKGTIRKEDQCILVEGYTDVISLHDGGVKNAVASSGTSLTEEQIRLIKRYTPNILILYDGDQAGVKAAIRGIDLILEQDMNVKIAMLPEGEDPDSYIRTKGAEEFNAYLNQFAKDFILFKAGLLQEETVNDPIRKTGVIRDIVASIARIPDPIKRSLYIQECSRLMDVTEGILINETNKEIKALLKVSQHKRKNESSRLPREHELHDVKATEKQTGSTIDEGDAYQEKDLLRILIEHGAKWHDENKGIRVSDLIAEIVGPLVDALDHPVCKKIFTYILEEYEPGQELNVSKLKNHPDEIIAQTVIDIMSSPHDLSENWESRWGIVLLQKHPSENEDFDVEQGLLRFHLRKLSKLIRDQQEKIQSQKDLPEEELVVQLTLLNKLLEKRNNIAHQLNTITW
jgi:DNA primase